MTSRDLDHSEAAASVLALMVAANGRIDEHELRMLDELHAYKRVGVSRARFLELARTCLADVGSAVSGKQGSATPVMPDLQELLDAVTDREMRLTVCRLAAASITADGQISDDERRVYDQVLSRWHLNQSMVSQAILADRGT